MKPASHVGPIAVQDATISRIQPHITKFTPHAHPSIHAAAVYDHRFTKNWRRRRRRREEEKEEEEEEKEGG